MYASRNGYGGGTQAWPQDLRDSIHGHNKVISFHKWPAAETIPDKPSKAAKLSRMLSKESTIMPAASSSEETSSLAARPGLPDGRPGPPWNF